MTSVPKQESEPIHAPKELNKTVNVVWAPHSRIIALGSLVAHVGQLDISRWALAKEIHVDKPLEIDHTQHTITFLLSW
jgi:hypothetical protein